MRSAAAPRMPNYHILELAAGSAFSEMMGASSAPEILLFKKFQAYRCWQFVDQI